MDKLRAPFPWFGGKSRVAHLVWERFGEDVMNYVEPFAGSLAVLLGRPQVGRVETVNDLDCYLANFWRAVQQAPEEVARFADWPVNEADLHARHTWLVSREEFREQMKTDPEFCDSKVAGWWVWGISSWIGSGWCARPEWAGRIHAGTTPKGIHARNPRTSGREVWRKRPSLADGGRGVHRVVQKIPVLTCTQGVNAKSRDIAAVIASLADRLRLVRVCCGDFERVCGPAVTDSIGTTAVFLDPPYGADRDAVYTEDSFDVAARVRVWAIDRGECRSLRIALCGYEGEHAMPAGWRSVLWKSYGGYGNNGQGIGRKNAEREVIWFSPHCLAPLKERDLFHAHE